MTVYERITALIKTNKLSQGRLEKALGFSNGSISKWKNSTPSSDRLQKVADYFGVTVEYLMTGEDAEPEFTAKNEKDIKNAIEAIKNQLSTGTGLMYDGEPIDQESQDAILAAIEVAERTAILEARKKFTPNKYKK